VEFEKQNANAGAGRFGLPNDPVEKFLVAPPDANLQLIAENLWPDQPPTFKSNVTTYFSAMKKLVEIMMHVFSQVLNVPGYEEVIYNRCRNGEHRLKNHLYPPDSVKKPMQDTQFAEHTDFAAFTLLATDACPGSLQVFDDKNKQWVPVPPKDGMFIVNLGDPIARWTNDHWKAPLHKVGWPESKGNGNVGRLAMPFFAYANKDSILDSIPIFVKEGETPKYQPITYDQYAEIKFHAIKHGTALRS